MMGSPLTMQGDLQQDSNRIAQAVQGLALRRRQSIDTVRSSEFGEGGKWDRAWGGSDDEEDDDGEGYGINHGQSLADLDVEGRNGLGWGALHQVGDGQWQSRDESKRATLTASPRVTDSGQFPALHDASGVEHVVSLTPSRKKTAQTLGSRANNQQDEQLHRRDTMRSVAGDVGWDSSSSSPSAYQESTPTSGVLASSSQQSFASGNSQDNAHVYVWPPTPAASEHGGSSEGKHGKDSRRDTLQAYSPGMATAQRARIETVPPESPSRSAPQAASVTTPKTMPQKPWSPSAVLANPNEIMTTPENYSRPKMRRVASGQSAGHPTGRLPPQPPTTSPHADRYADPNMPLSSTMADFGAARRQAIADRDGRESLVSDLDVETLRLDGSNDGDSRRGSVTSIGSFSSAKIREQRERQSHASFDSSYSQASNNSAHQDKRSSNGTVREMPLPVRRIDAQHHSWNGNNMRYEGLSDLTAAQAEQMRRGPPKRSNTGPDSYRQEYESQARSRLSAGPLHEQQRSVSSPQSQSQGQGQGNSLTFSTPQPDRTDKKASIAVKGALNDTQAEKFLSLAITHHETGDLSRSAYYFERSAKVEGGCIVGMCMWGMALREGWGVRKDQKKGFEWISRAAARAGELMAGSQGGVKSEAELKAIRSEMKLSVYELGKCFCYGWGVKMDKPMALEYFELAARLGDADAQAEAGALLAAGKGCKKDLKKAAMYYRMAEAQGYDTVGLSWIHKDKYDP